MVISTTRGEEAMKMRAVTSCSILLMIAGVFGTCAAHAQSCEAPRYGEWVNSVGDIAGEYGTNVRLDPAGRIIVSGRYEGAERGGYNVDFDPTGGEDRHVTVGRSDVFVTVYEADGSYAWTRTFGSLHSESPRGLSIDREGTIFVSGSFGQGTFEKPHSRIDFDPGPRRDSRRCQNVCIYVTRFRPNGQYGGTLTLGDKHNPVYGGRTAVDPFDDIYLFGTFQGTVDFDPGPGESILIDNVRNYARFLAKYTADYEHLWAMLMPAQVNYMDFDREGNLYYTGTFDAYYDIDFDPGPGEDILPRVPGNGREVYITRINADRSYGWTRTIGQCPGDIDVASIDVDGDAVYLAGHFRDEADFDPGPLEDFRYDTEGSYSAAYFLKLDTRGRYHWVHSLNGEGAQIGVAMRGDGRGGVVCTGHFALTVNFDPDGEGDWQTGEGGGSNTFVSKLTAERDYCWTRLITAPGFTDPQDIEATDDGRIIVMGDFYSSGPDFDPTDGVDRRFTRGSHDLYTTTWLSDTDCDALLSHGLRTKKNGTVLSTMTTTLPGGKVKLRLASDADPPTSRTRTTRLDPQGCAVTRFDGLPHGRHEVRIQWIEDEKGTRLCDGPLMKRSTVTR